MCASNNSLDEIVSCIHHQSAITKLQQPRPRLSSQVSNSNCSTNRQRFRIVIHTRIRSRSWNSAISENNQRASEIAERNNDAIKRTTSPVSSASINRSSISPTSNVKENINENIEKSSFEQQKSLTADKLVFGKQYDNLRDQSHKDSHTHLKRKRDKIMNFFQCSKLLVLLLALLALLCAAAATAAVILSTRTKSHSETTTLNIMNTTTDVNATTPSTTANVNTTITSTTIDFNTTTSTTTTETTTYAATGIYALQIPKCATWNQTGITVAGRPGGAFGSALNQLDGPVSIFVDNNYTLYIADRDNNRIMKYYDGASSGIIVAGNGTAGSSSTQLNSPKGVAVDQSGAILVGDGFNYRIQRFPFGSISATTESINSSTNLLGDTRDLYIDVNNNIYVTDSSYNRVVKYAPNSGIGVILAGNNGQGSAMNQLSTPYGSFMGPNQTLFVADSDNHRIQMWSAGATTGQTVAGVSGSSGSGLLRLDGPRSVILDNNGFLYIVDSNNHRVVRWTMNYTAGGECIVACTNNWGTQANRLYFPRDLKFDASGNLYVNDQRNNRIQKFMIQIPPNCTASG